MTAARRSAALRAWLIAGTLDIAYAMAWTTLAGGTVGGMLRGIAKGPFGDGAGGWGPGGALAGLGVHFAIMAAMVALWFAAVRRWPTLGAARWGWTGALYGLFLYLAMNAVVLPLRFGAPFPPADPVQALIALIPHILLVGWPIARFAQVKDTR